jgi:hypothetical protein
MAVMGNNVRMVVEIHGERNIPMQTKGMVNYSIHIIDTLHEIFEMKFLNEN